MNNLFYWEWSANKRKVEELVGKEKKTTTQNHEDFSGINDGSAFIVSGGERNQV